MAMGCGSEAAQEPTQGALLYQQNCLSCHGDAVTGAGRIAPGIPVHGPSGHTWHHADGLLIDLVLGQFQYPGREMPSFEGSLAEEEVVQILDYLKGSWTVEMLEYQADATRAWAEPR